MLNHAIGKNRIPRRYPTRDSIQGHYLTVLSNLIGITIRCLTATSPCLAGVISLKTEH